MCNQMTLNKILKEVRKIYEEVYGDKLVKVILYGSYARGDYDDESDIDIVGIVNENRIDAQKHEKKLWVLTSDIDLKYGILTSPTAIPYEEYREYMEFLPYYKNIEKEGIEIVAWF